MKHAQCKCINNIFWAKQRMEEGKKSTKKSEHTYETSFIAETKVNKVRSKTMMKWWGHDFATS